MTTDTTLCLHDPLFKHHYEDLDGLESTKRLGLSCTGLGQFTDWVNKHPASKVILHRDLREVNESLAEIGLSPITQENIDRLYKLDGLHVPWDDLFRNPRPIYEHLLQLPFDEERHQFLTEIQMQPEFSKLKVNKEATRRLVEEMASWA